MNTDKVSYNNSSKLVDCGNFVSHINWVPGGYHYWTSMRMRYGWRQLGKEAFCIVDDFGSLVFVEKQPQAQ